VEKTLFRDFMFPCKIDEHENELARRAQLEATARLRAAVRGVDIHWASCLLRDETPA
jgi:hypothetical protein